VLKEEFNRHETKKKLSKIIDNPNQPFWTEYILIATVFIFYLIFSQSSAFFHKVKFAHICTAGF